MSTPKTPHRNRLAVALLFFAAFAAHVGALMAQQPAKTAHAQRFHDLKGWRPTYGPQKAVGPPDVTAPGDSHSAWCHAGAATISEWIELSFSTPVQATELRVRQNNASGAIVKVEAVASDGASHVLWEGEDPTTHPQEACIQWFVLRLLRTKFLVARIKLTLDLTRPGWEEIDAVQLVGAR